MELSLLVLVLLVLLVLLFRVLGLVVLLEGPRATLPFFLFETTELLLLLVVLEAWSRVLVLVLLEALRTTLLLLLLSPGMLSARAGVVTTAAVSGVGTWLGVSGAENTSISRVEFFTGHLLGDLPAAFL